MSVISWQKGKLARDARNSSAAELQAAADAEGELTDFRMSLWEIFGGAAPLKKWQKVAAQVAATLELDSEAFRFARAQRVMVLGTQKKTNDQVLKHCEEVIGRDTGQQDNSGLHHQRI